ncbi:MAG TPA: hypothetical protein VMT47_09440 [Polyangia bacterium]|nr:hypothetical protein [Polyangia bacterium]
MARLFARAACALAACALGLPAPRAARAEEPGGSAAPAGLVHEAITNGQRGSVIAVTVSVQNELVFAQLVLAYRPEGESDFHGREMKLVAPGTYRAEIPAQGTRGRTVAYYVEARDKDGAPVAGRASAQSPLIIQLAGELPDGPLAKDGGPGVRPGEDDDEGDGLAGQRIFVGLLVGTGAGWAAGNGDTNADTMYKPAAFAFAGLGQLAPEVGYWLSPTLMISLQGRFQAVTGTTDVYADGRIYHTANYAAAAFIKTTWLARRPGSAHPFFSLAAGIGQIRHVVTFDSLRACGPSGQDVCVDTIAAGPVAVGPGAGVFIDLGAHLVGVFELDTQLTFPTYSVNVDGNLGLAVRF